MLDARIDVEQFFKHHPIGEAGRFALLAEHRDTRFVPVATHQQGELNCASRRITVVLDLKASYQRLKAWRSVGRRACSIASPPDGKTGAEGTDKKEHSPRCPWAARDEVTNLQDFASAIALSILRYAKMARGLLLIGIQRGFMLWPVPGISR